MQFNCVIIGGGIAGIASAEMLQGSELNVLLIEKRNELASLLSGRQHSWFHTGRLYSAPIDPKIQEVCIHNLNTLIHHYSEFPGMNIRINAGHFEVIERNPLGIGSEQNY